MMGQQQPAALAPVAVDALLDDQVAEERVRVERVGDQRPSEVTVATHERVGSVLELRDDHPAVAGAGPDPGVSRRRPRRRSVPDAARPAAAVTPQYPAPITTTSARRGGSAAGSCGFRLGDHPVVPQRSLAVAGGERSGHAGMVRPQFTARPRS